MLAAALAAVALAGCGGAGMLLDDLDAPDDAALLAAADVDAPDGVAEADGPAVVTPPEVPETPEPVTAELSPADTAARAEADAEKARAVAGAARVASAATPPPARPEEPAAAKAVDESEAAAPVPAATLAAVAPAEGGGIGVWLLGFLLTGMVAGGGWFALQPKWVRRRVLRAFRKAPARLVAKLRGRGAGEDEKAPAWQARAPRIVLSSQIVGSRSDAVAPGGKSARRSKGITNATLPAMEVPPDGGDPNRN